jgi:gliding motility-associated-like protein
MIAYDLTCNHVDTITDTAVFISNFSYANATAPPNVMLCDPPYDVDFYSSSGTPHVFWDFGDGVGTSNLDSLTYTYADTGTYQVMYIAIDSSTCNIADTAYFTVDLDQAEQLSAEFDIPVIDPCTDTSQMLVELLFTGTAADSIVWDMGDGTVFYDSTSISYLYTTQGIYIISMTAWDFTCNNIDTLIDTVEFYVSYSQANANASPNILACDPPYDVTFNSGAPSPPHSFWDFADGDTSILHNPMHTFTDTGYYNIMYIATDSTTCNISDTVYLSVEIRLSENFSAELDFVPPPPCGSDSMLVEMAFTGSGADSLIWDMGNGILFNDSALSYYYTIPGYYTVSLTAFDTLCNKVETIDESVYYAGNFQSEYIVPNIFTPNGDGENDRLVFINANDTKEFSISIFNRWGGLVYQSDNVNIAWDGRSPAGKEENEGIFYFELKYTDKCSDEEILETGFVHLIR